MNYRTIILLLLGASSSLVSAKANQIQEPSMAKLLENSPPRYAPRELEKRQSPVDVCGLGYVLCDTTHCCSSGEYCQLRSGVWYCPVLSNTNTYQYTTSYYTDPYSYGPTTIDYTESPTGGASQTSGDEDPSPTDADDQNTTTGGGTKKKKKKGISTGAIVGIIIAVVILLIIAAVALIIFFKKRTAPKGAAVAPPPGPQQQQQPLMAQQPQPQPTFSPQPQQQPFYAPQAPPYPAGPTPQQYAAPAPQYPGYAVADGAAAKADGGYYGPQPQVNPQGQYPQQPYPPPSPQPYPPPAQLAEAPAAVAHPPQSPPPPQQPRNVYEIGN